jgi:hypothetical protein
MWSGISKLVMSKIVVRRGVAALLYRKSVRSGYGEKASPRWCVTKLWRPRALSSKGVSLGSTLKPHDAMPAKDGVK